MLIFLTALVGLIIGGYTLQVYPEKSKLKFPEKTTTDPEELLANIVRVTLLVVPYALWTIGLWIWGSNLLNAITGTKIPISQENFIGACWAPLAFALGIILLTQLAEHIRKKGNSP